MTSNEKWESEEPSSIPHNNGNLTKLVLPGLYFLLNKMERAAVMAMLPDQIREGAEKAPWALQNKDKCLFVWYSKEIIIKVSIYLFASTEPIQYKINTMNRILSPCTQDHSANIYGLWANLIHIHTHINTHTHRQTHTYTNITTCTNTHTHCTNT